MLGLSGVKGGCGRDVDQGRWRGGRELLTGAPCRAARVVREHILAVDEVQAKELDGEENGFF